MCRSRASARAQRAAAVAAVLARRLGHQFQQRDSHYMGDYWLAHVGSATVKIVSQPDSYGDPVDDAFSDYGSLIYVDGDGVADLGGTPVEQGVIERLRESG